MRKNVFKASLLLLSLLGSCLIGCFKHTCNISTEWSADNGYHYHACSGCDERYDVETHSLNKTDAVSPTHSNSGNIEYWSCSVCHLYFSDENGINQISYSSTYLAALGHAGLTYHPKVPATCTESGIEAYYECSCGLYQDQACTNKINAPIVINALGHDISTNWSAKNGKHYHECSRCTALFDEASHNLSHVDAKEPTETETGNIAHYYCSTCNKYFSDSQGLEELNSRSVFIPSLSTKYNVADYYDGYYSSIVSWTDGEDLTNQLHDLISSNYNKLSFNDSGDVKWEMNQTTEQDLYDYTKLNVLYSDKAVNKTETQSGWQREHAFCASLMTGYNTSNSTAVPSGGGNRATDYHNLFAASQGGNSSRSNKNFGIANRDNLTITNAKNADFVCDNLNFEPSDEDKGQVARAIFYMGVMYNQDETCSISLDFKYGDNKTKSVTIPAKFKALSIEEEYVDFSMVEFSKFCSSTEEDHAALRNKYLTKYTNNGDALDNTTAPDNATISPYAQAYSDYRYAEAPFAIGNRSTLISWNSIPVSRSEYQHNEQVYSHIYSKRGVAQHNRNPFVDYPGLVDYVYGDLFDTPGVMASITPTSTLIDVSSTEVSNYALASYKDSYNVGDTLSSSDYCIYKVLCNYSYSTCDVSKLNSDYVFTSADVGTKEITVNTPKNSLKYVVTVKETNPIDQCSYKHVLTDAFKGQSNGATISCGALSWVTSWSNINCKGAVKMDADMGVTFGGSTTSQAKPVNELVLASSTSLTNVNKFYALISCASQKTIDYSLYVGTTLVSSGSYTRGPGVTEPYLVGADFANLSGKAILCINGSGAQNGAVYVHTIALNY